MPVSPEHIKQAQQNIELLINNGKPFDYFELSENSKVSANLLFKSRSTEHLRLYLQNLIQGLINTEQDERNQDWQILYILIQRLLHQRQDLGDIEIPDVFRREPLTYNKLFLFDERNTLHNQNDLVHINYNPRTGKYTSPDDDMAHRHGEEASRIFFSTQRERIKAVLHDFFAFFGIHVFESAVYEEHHYLSTDIYANHLGIEPANNDTTTHFWLGHASNLLTIPTDTTPLHVLTDPVEGDLNALLYPRRTEVANQVNGHGEKILPKVDVIIISHNHRDHVDVDTLKALVPQQPLMVIPAGDRALFESLGFTNVVELTWWQQVTMSRGDNEVLRITAVPTRHWSNRHLADTHLSSFNGYVLQNPQRQNEDIYFAGDTALMRDDISAPIFRHFNIKTSIQPGGPDEVREDMKSTHQSSADALLMHFKNLSAYYQRLGAENNEVSKENFLHQTKDIRTLFNHTATFKLGNLHLRDTFYSMNRVIAAFLENEEWAKNNLASYEFDVYEQINSLVQAMPFNNGQTLSGQEIANILTRSITMPKIGERQQINNDYESTNQFSYRNLIIQKRGLVEFDKITRHYLQNGNLVEFGTNELKHTIGLLFDAYQKPWYGKLTRSYRSLATYAEALNACQNTQAVMLVIREMEREMHPLNRYGHAHALINYAKWLIQKEENGNGLENLNDFFDCQQAKNQIDAEINRGGFGRQEKQAAFKDLANRLAEANEISKAAYKDIFDSWQETNQRLLDKHRFFGKGMTHSHVVAEELNELLTPAL